MRLAAIAIALTAASPSLAGADCANEATNLLAQRNCGFAKDTAGWSTESPAAIRHDAANGDPAAGALLADGGPQGSVTVVGPCVPAKPSTSHAYAAHLRLARGNAYYCNVQLFQFTDQSCQEGSEPLGAQGRPPDATWRIASASASTGEPTRSLEVRLVCSGEPGFAVLWDDVYVGVP